MVIKKNSLKKIDNKLLRENFNKIETFDKKDRNNVSFPISQQIPTIKSTLNQSKGNKKTIDVENSSIKIKDKKDVNIKRKHQNKIYKKTFTKNKNIKRLNIKKNRSKKKERYVRLLIDSHIDVKGRMETKKKIP